MGHQIHTLIRLSTAFLLAFCMLPMLAGCGRSSHDQAAPGRVAVIDMDQLAHASGFSQRLGTILQRVQEEEHARLQAMQQQLGIVPNAPRPTDPAAAERMGQAQMRMREAIEQAQQRIETIRFTELDQFRNIVRPIAERVAHAKGCSIVMEKREDMLSVDPTSDITDEVIAELPRGVGGAPAPTPGIPPGMAPGTSPGTIPGAIPGSGGQSPSGSIPREFLPPAGQPPATAPTTAPGE